MSDVGKYFETGGGAESFPEKDKDLPVNGNPFQAVRIILNDLDELAKVGAINDTELTELAKNLSPDDFGDRVSNEVSSALRSENLGSFQERVELGRKIFNRVKESLSIDVVQTLAITILSVLIRALVYHLQGAGELAQLSTSYTNQLRKLVNEMEDYLDGLNNQIVTE